MNYYDLKNGFSYLKYWDINNLYRWEMLQELPVGGSAQVEDKDFLKTRLKIVRKRIS